MHACVYPAPCSLLLAPCRQLCRYCHGSSQPVDVSTALLPNPTPGCGRANGIAPSNLHLAVKSSPLPRLLSLFSSDASALLARLPLWCEQMAGVLRLHATYRHDLKIYASDEGRVQMTAAAFAKGFLDLEGRM